MKFFTYFLFLIFFPFCTFSQTWNGENLYQLKNSLDVNPDYQDFLTYWDSDTGPRFYKFFKDVDNDGFGDTNHYIPLPGAYNHQGDNWMIPDVHEYEITLPEYFENTNVRSYNVVVSYINYDGYRWIHWKTYWAMCGFSYGWSKDCNDNINSIPSALRIVYPDDDGDGYGDDGGWKRVPFECGIPSGYVSNNNDCNDFDSNITTNPILWFADSDQDGYGDPNISVLECHKPGGYVGNSEDCDDNNSEYTGEYLTWYADFDQDGFGDSNNTLLSKCPPVSGNYIKNCLMDSCPNTYGERENGCPLIEYDFDSQNYNYTYSRTYKDKVKIENLSNVDDGEVIEVVNYTNALGKNLQDVYLRASPQNKDIIVPHEYDGNNEEEKSYLPYTKINNLGAFDENSILHVQNFYDRSIYDFTLNPYSEIQREDSPLNRLIERGSPGASWEIGGGDHTTKIQYGVNSNFEVINFYVTHPNFDYQTELNFGGYYEANDLQKIIIKGENWEPTLVNPKLNTKEIYKDKNGNIVLKRNYVLNDEYQLDILNTHYVYDDFDKLTYVIPPLAADQIIDPIPRSSEIQINYPWTKLVDVDSKFADYYDHLLTDYKNQDILNANLENEYGGQGGFSVTTTQDSEIVTLAIVFSANQPFALKQGELVSLDAHGKYKNAELGRISGEGYEYIFTIQNNIIVIKGHGKIEGVNKNFSSNTALSYSQNYPWTTYTKTDPAFARGYEEQLKNYTNNEILSINISNEHNGHGGMNISIDEEDKITVTINHNSTTPFSLKQGLVIPLEGARRQVDRVLDTLIGPGYKYIFSVRENNLMIQGDGELTSLSATMIEASPINTISTSAVEGLCYIYHYDDENRLIEKKIPGKGWVYLIYDILDRPTLIQDAKMRLENMWLFTKYDGFGRIVYSGKYIYNPVGIWENAARLELQENINTQINPKGSEIYGSSSIIDGKQIYYSNHCFPTTNLALLTVNYYDTYPFNMQGAPPSTILGQEVTSATQDLLTVTQEKILGTNFWITNTIFYDEEANPIFTIAENELFNSRDESKILYDFIGNKLQTKSFHTFDQNPSLTLQNDFSYDHMGRLLIETQNINGGESELIVNNSYDELGQLINKKVGGEVASDPINSIGLQSIDYSYNVRGWLREINQFSSNIANNDLFAFKINYNQPESPAVSPLFNGNVSETFWITKSDQQARSYAYAYDAINRIKTAYFDGGGLSSMGPGIHLENYSLNNVSYDKNGNILSLERMGLHFNAQGDPESIDIIDDLSYFYAPESNKLIRVTDTAHDEGFDDGGNSGDDYEYDVNGNMVLDKNKQIAISYNLLNLPNRVSKDFDAEGYIEYIYSATGSKLQKKVFDVDNNNIPVVTSYVGNYLYEDDALQFFNHSEGYVKLNTQGNFDYVYQYKDHLGNIRLSYSDLNNDNSIDPVTEILEENNYYPFGMRHKGYNNVVNGLDHKWDFLGQERQEEFDINWLSFRHRNYMPEIGRFFGVDPIAEYFYYLTPYQVAHNNPVWKIEIEGLEGIPHEGQDVMNEEDDDMDFGERSEEDAWRIELDEVVVCATLDEEEEEYFEWYEDEFRYLDGFPVWGYGTQDRGPQGRPVRSLDMEDFPGIQNGRTSNKIVGFLELLQDWVVTLTDMFEQTPDPEISKEDDKKIEKQRNNEKSRKFGIILYKNWYSNDLHPVTQHDTVNRTLRELEQYSDSVMGHNEWPHGNRSDRGYVTDSIRTIELFD